MDLIINNIIGDVKNLIATVKYFDIPCLRYTSPSHRMRVSFVYTFSLIYNQATIYLRRMCQERRFPLKGG